MQLKAEAITKTVRADKQGVMCWGIKSGEKWYDLYADNPPKRGQTINVEVGQDGKKIRYMGTQPAPSQQTDNGRSATPASHAPITFWQYMEAMKIAHGVACDLEPDDQGEHVCERSQARAALVNTAMIALTSGKIELPPV